MNKKAQNMTVFVIVGLIIVILLGFAFVSLNKGKSDDFKKTGEEVSFANLDDFNVYTEECIKSTADEGIQNLGYQDKDALEFYMESNLVKCVDSYSQYSNQGYEVNYDDPISTVSIDADSVKFEVDFNVEVSKGETKANFDSFSYLYQRVDSMSTNNGVIPKGTKQIMDDSLQIEATEEISIKDAEGNPVSEIQLNVFDQHKDGRKNSLVVGNKIYEFSPEGAVLEPGLSVTIKVPKEDVVNTISPHNLLLSYYDEELDVWVAHPNQELTEDDSYYYISATVSHFSDQAVVFCSTDEGQVLFPHIPDEGEFFRHAILPDEEYYWYSNPDKDFTKALFPEISYNMASCEIHDPGEFRAAHYNEDVCENAVSDWDKDDQKFANQAQAAAIEFFILPKTGEELYTEGQTVPESLRAMTVTYYEDSEEKSIDIWKDTESDPSRMYAISNPGLYVDLQKKCYESCQEFAAQNLRKYILLGKSRSDVDDPDVEGVNNELANMGHEVRDEGRDLAFGGTGMAVSDYFYGYTIEREDGRDVHVPVGDGINDNANLRCFIDYSDFQYCLHGSGCTNVYEGEKDSYRFVIDPDAEPQCFIPTDIGGEEVREDNLLEYSKGGLLREKNNNARLQSFWTMKPEDQYENYFFATYMTYGYDNTLYSSGADDDVGGSITYSLVLEDSGGACIRPESQKLAIAVGASFNAEDDIEIIDVGTGQPLAIQTSPNCEELGVDTCWHDYTLAAGTNFYKINYQNFDSDPEAIIEWLSVKFFGAGVIQNEFIPTRLNPLTKDQLLQIVGCSGGSKPPVAGERQFLWEVINALPDGTYDNINELTNCGVKCSSAYTDARVVTDEGEPRANPAAYVVSKYDELRVEPGQCEVPGCEDTVEEHYYDITQCNRPGIVRERLQGNSYLEDWGSAEACLKGITGYACGDDYDECNEGNIIGQLRTLIGYCEDNVYVCPTGVQLSDLHAGCKCGDDEFPANNQLSGVMCAGDNFVADFYGKFGEAITVESQIVILEVQGDSFALPYADDCDYEITLDQNLVVIDEGDAFCLSHFDFGDLPQAATTLAVSQEVSLTEPSILEDFGTCTDDFSYSYTLDGGASYWTLQCEYRMLSLLQEGSHVTLDCSDYQRESSAVLEVSDSCLRCCDTGTESPRYQWMPICEECPVVEAEAAGGAGAGGFVEEPYTEVGTIELKVHETVEDYNDFYQLATNNDGDANKLECDFGGVEEFVEVLPSGEDGIKAILWTCDEEGRLLANVIDEGDYDDYLTDDMNSFIEEKEFIRILDDYCFYTPEESYFNYQEEEYNPYMFGCYDDTLDICVYSGCEFSQNTVDALTSGRIIIPSAACPFLYSWDGTDYTFDSTIIYKLVGEDAEAVQYRELEHLSLEGPVKVRISEVEPETSYLDHIRIKLTDTKGNDVVVTYLDVVESSRDLDKLTASDDEYLVTVQGDEVFLVFEDAPELAEGYAREAGVEAEGYYTWN
jgi:hypothetical protein